MNHQDVVAGVRKLKPRSGDVVVIDLAPSADEAPAAMAALSHELGEIARKTGATVLLLPADVRLDLIDEREMLARGWMRVGPLAHTTAQLAASPPTDKPTDLSSA